MKNLIILVIAFISTISTMAQVTTQGYEKNKAFDEFPKFLVTKQNSPVKKMPLFDVTPLLAEDEVSKDLDLPYRFGKGFEVEISLKDGKWQNFESERIWSIKIVSAGAYSLNFIIRDLILPKGGELFIYNEEGTMVYGPLTEQHNIINDIFLTDIIQGESVIFHLSIPDIVKEDPLLTIQKVVHGYKNLLKSYGDGGDCTNDVTCYPAYSDEADGIVQIVLSNGIEICSGVLLNNTAQDYRPFVLTAFHCIDIGIAGLPGLDEDRKLHDLEIGQAQRWLIKFRYRHTTCGGSTFANTRGYNGNTFRAAWDSTDFALVELNANIYQDIYSVGEKVWLGWDRTGNTPSSAVCIHHPSGDVQNFP